MNDAFIVDTGPILYLAGFSKMIKGDQSIIFAVVPERVPLLMTKDKESKLYGF